MASTPALPSSATEVQQEGSLWAQAQQLAKKADLEAKLAENARQSALQWYIAGVSCDTCYTTCFGQGLTCCWVSC